MTIDPERLLSDLQTLRGFGKDRTGVHRLALSDEDMAARRWIMERMADAGLVPEMDAMGTVIGRTRQPGRPVLIGSHTDSVPHGGWLDGALGVVYGLEAVRAHPDLPIDVINFQDEEGTFLSCAGSQVFSGSIEPADILERVDAEGRRLGGELQRHGLAGREWLRGGPGHYLGFLEAHIEQGPVLEQSGTDIAVVEGIVGSRRWRVNFAGRADHAGTTPMSMRRDAGSALFHFAHDLLCRFEAASGADTVWNLGHAALEPGASNVVPAFAELFVECRDIDDALLHRFSDLVEQTAREVVDSVEVTLTGAVAKPATPMHDAVIGLFEDACVECGRSFRRLASGAGHDAMYVANIMPAGMIFIPSIGGRSHDISENSHHHNIVQGCEVMAAAARRVATSLSGA